MTFLLGGLVLSLVVIVVASTLSDDGRGRSRPRGTRSATRPATRSATTVPAQRDGQADLVQAWAVKDAPVCLVANESSRPVHDVRAFVALGRRRRSTFVGWVKTLEPTGAKPAKVALSADAREAWLRWLDQQAGAGTDVAVEFTFRDSDGQYWHRTRRGDLVPTDDSGAALHLGRSRVVPTLGRAG